MFIALKRFSVQHLSPAIVCATFLLAAGAQAQTLTITDDVQTYATLPNTAVTVSGVSQLRITSGSSPITGSTFNLTSPDSWLFLLGIRPSAVNSTYRSQIKINGAAAVLNTNCRIVQYGDGTVIIPQSSSYAGLQIFTGPMFSGTAKPLSPYTAYSTSNLGAFDGNVGSFKLKRGYTATFAENADGSGASRNFVAADGDIEVGAMPSDIGSAVSFIRVFPWRWTNKKGIAGSISSGLNVRWHYNWSISENSSLDDEYVPIRQSRYWPGLGQDWKARGSNQLLGYNEPDRLDQANISVATALDGWGDLLSTGLRVGAPAVSDGGRGWLYSFMDQAGDAGCRVDFVPIHRYVCYNPADAAGAASAMYSALKAVHDRVKRPIWITEWNNGANWTSCGDPSFDQQKAAVQAMIDMLESTPWVERYALYNWVEDCRRVKWNDGSLTKAGVAYRDKASNLAYVQVVPSLPTNVRANYRFDGDARDNSGRSHNAILHGAARFAAGKTGKAVSLSGVAANQDYVQLPPRLSQTTDFTFGAWVYWNGGAANQRIFDLGDDTNAYMYLTPKGSTGVARFGINNGDGSQNVDSNAVLPANTWTHVAVTISGNTGKIFVNGVLKGTNTGITINPSSLGATSCYLGKSQWPSDPLFAGMIDDAYFFSYRLSDSLVPRMMTNTPPVFTSHALSTASATQKQAYNATIAGTASDADSGDSVAYFKGSGPSWLSVATNGALTGTPPATAEGPQVFVVYAVDAVGASDYAVLTIPLPSITGDGTWTADASGAWSDTTKWSNGFAANASGNTANFNSINITADTVVTLDAARTIGGLIFGDTSGAQSWTLNASGGSKLTLAVSTGSPSIAVNQNNATISLALVGTAGFTKTGAGTLTLTGANSLSGDIVLNGGTVALGRDTAFGTGVINLNGVAIRSADTSDRTIANAITLSANTTFGSAETGSLAFTGDVNAGGLAKILTINNARTEFSGVIGGAGARTKGGNGTLVLSGANTYTGATTVSGGTLALTGSIATGALTCAAGTTLTGKGSIGGNTTINGTHSPGDGVGSQSFAGTLTYGAGSRLAWQLAGNTVSSDACDLVSAKGVTVNNGARIDVVLNAAGSTVDFSSSFWLYPRRWTVLAGTGISGSFAVGDVSGDPAGRAASNYGTFGVQQSGTQVVLTFMPVNGVPLPQQPVGVRTVVGSNQVTLSWQASEGAEGYTILRATSPGGPYTAVATGVTGTSFRDLTAVDGTTYYYVIAPTNSAGTGTYSMEMLVVPHQPTVVGKSDNTLDLNVAGSWVNNVMPSTGDIAMWTGLTGANAVSLGSDLALKGLTIGATGGAVSITGDKLLITGVSGIDMSPANQDLTVSSHLEISPGHQVWNIPSGRTLTLDTGTFVRASGASLAIQGNGTVSANMDELANDGSSGGGLIRWATTGTRFATISGIGTLNSYMSSTSVANFGWAVNSGNGDDIVNYDVAATTGNLGVPRTANTVRYTGATGTQGYGSSNTCLLPLNALLNAGTGTLTIAQNAGVSGFVAGTGEGEGELLLIAATAGITISAPIYDSETTTSGATDDVSLGNVPAAVTIVGPYTVTLSGANLFTGGVNLNSGTLLAGNAAALGGTAGTFNMNGGTFGTVAAVTIPNNIQVTGVNTLGYSGQGSDFTLTGALSGSGTLQNSLVMNSAKHVFFKGDMSRFTGSFIHTGDSGAATQWWSFGATNATTDLSNASVVLNKGNVTNFTVSSKTFGFTDGIAGATLKLGALSGDGVFQASYNNSGPNTLQVGALGTNTTFAGVIAGSNGGANMAFTKVGTGKLTLSGTSYYSGATTVNAGTLVVNGTLIGAGAVSVADGAVLGGGGTVFGRVTLAAGAALSAGAGGGGAFIASGGLTLNNGSILNFGLGTFSNRITLGASLGASGTTVINLRALDGFGSGTYQLVTGAANISTANFVLGSVPAGYSYSLSAGNGALSVTVISPADLWRQQNFGVNWQNDSIAGDAADPDGDGLSNLLERAFGGNPNMADRNLSPATDNLAPILNIVYRKSKAATDLAYVVQETQDPASGAWTTASGTSVSLSDDGSVETIRFTAPPGAAGRKFLRVQVVKP